MVLAACIWFALGVCVGLLWACLGISGVFNVKDDNTYED